MRLLFWIGSILIRHDVRLVGAVLADDFFHPNHVVPAPELIAAVVEGTGQREAQMFVELGTVFGEVFVLHLRGKYSLSLKSTLEGSSTFVSPSKLL